MCIPGAIKVGIMELVKNKEIEMPYALIYDVGTSSLKLMLYDEKSEVIFVNSYPYEYATPKSGWAEINPRKWEQAL